MNNRFYVNVEEEIELKKKLLKIQEIFWCNILFKLQINNCYLFIIAHVKWIGQLHLHPPKLKEQGPHLHHRR